MKSRAFGRVRRARVEKELRDLMARHGIAWMTSLAHGGGVLLASDADGAVLFSISRISQQGKLGEVEEFKP